MMRTVGSKLVHLVPVLFFVSLATFLLIELVPGDVALTIAGQDATAEQIEAIRDELDVDRPLHVRYVDWLGDIVRGDLGNSLVPPNQDVSDMVRARLPVTLQIAAMALILSFLIAVPVALRAAHRPDDPFDRTVAAGAFASISIPSFLASLLLIFFFVFHRNMVRVTLAIVVAVALAAFVVGTVKRWRHFRPGLRRTKYVCTRSLFLLVAIACTASLVAWFPHFPRQGFVRLTDDEGLIENLRHAWLPALALASIEGAVFMRLLRSDLLETLSEDYILFARAKGMPTWRILFADALRPSSFSLITIAGVAFGRAIGGTVIVETIFNLPGMGTMTVRAISNRDYPVVQGAVLVIAVFYVLINAMVDVSYAYLDPRVRRREA